MVIRVDPPLDLPDLVLEADALEELERLAQRAGKVALEGARGAGGAKAFRCRAEADRASRQACVAGDCGDRQQSTLFDVEPTAMLAGALDDEVAQEADGGLVSQRQAEHQTKQPPPLTSHQELLAKVGGAAVVMEDATVQEQ